MHFLLIFGASKAEFVMFYALGASGFEFVICLASYDLRVCRVN
jgi:hypothetical protein